MESLRSILLRTARLPLSVPIFERLLRRFTVGRPYDSFLSQIPPKHVAYPRPSLREAELNGVRYSVDISDLVGWHTYWGFSEESQLRLDRMIDPNDTVIDVGANIGSVALRAARIIGDQGHVFAFEPFPHNFEKLKANLNLNSFNNVTLVNQALGDEIGHSAMFVPEERNVGMTRMLSGGEVSDKTVTVEVNTLDRFVQSNNLQRTDVIKIDVEGYEMNVLRGALDTLRAHRPRLFIEITDAYLRKQGSSARSIMEFIEKLDYRMFHAQTGSKCSPGEMPPDAHYDLIALPAEIDAPSLRLQA